MPMPIPARSLEQPVDVRRGHPMPPTLWTLVTSAGGGSVAALEQLCLLYRQPIYAYLRAWGRKPEDAEDLTQMFLAHLLDKHRLSRVVPRLGRFRSYLLTALKHFLHDQSARARGPEPLPLPAETEASETSLEPPDPNGGPDLEFDRKFTMTLIQRTFDQLICEYAQRGQAERFELLQRFLPGKDPQMSQAEAGLRLGLSEGAVAKAVYDLRQRFRAVFRQHIGQTVRCYDEVEEELAHHLAIWSR
jgi:RNA polymerase sigma-70 factor (ECF subfamily)